MVSKSPNSRSESFFADAEAVESAFATNHYIADRALAEDNNPSRLHELAERYGTLGDWHPVDSPRQGREHDDNPFVAFRPDRCIACSLCTRYCDQVEAVSAITLAGRGADTTISTRLSLR